MRFFNIHSVAKHQKTEGGKMFYFRKKSQCRKKLKGGTLWDFSTSILSQSSKKLKGGPFDEKKFPEKKSRSAEQKLEGGTLWSRRVWYITRESWKNLFGPVR